jgi:lipopolysaccharide export system protein LptA
MKLYKKLKLPKNKLNKKILTKFIIFHFLLITLFLFFLIIINLNLIYSLENNIQNLKENLYDKKTQSEKKFKNQNENNVNNINNENNKKNKNNENNENTQKYIYHKSDKLVYDSKNKVFELVGNVEIFYEDTKVKCDLFRYYEDKDFGIASGKPTLYNPTTFIKSDTVELYFNIKKLVAKNNVYIKIKNQEEKSKKQPQKTKDNQNTKNKDKDNIKYFEIFTANLTYNWENEIVYIPNKVKIVSTNLYLYANTLTYNVKNNLIILKGQVYGKKDDQKIWTDKLTYNTKTETLVMEGNVKSIIKAQQKKNEESNNLQINNFKLLTASELYNNIIKENQKITSYFINKQLYSPYINININYYTTFDIYQANDLNYYIYNVNNKIYNNTNNPNEKYDNRKYLVYILPSNSEKAKNFSSIIQELQKQIYFSKQIYSTNEIYSNKEIYFSKDQKDFNNISKLYFILKHKDEKYVFFENLNQLYNNFLNSFENTYSLIYNNKITPVLIKDFRYTYYKSLIISEVYDQELINMLKNVYKKYNSAYIDLDDIENYNYLLKIAENFKEVPNTIVFNLNPNLISYLLINKNFLNLLNLNSEKIVIINSNEIYNYLNNRIYFYNFCKFIFNLSYIYNLKLVVDNDIYYKNLSKELKPYFQIYYNK